jgi:hypothetical protein
MTKPTITHQDATTGEIIEREMNAVEYAQYQVDQKANDVKKAEEAAKADAKAVLLNRLGITAEEAALLFA